MNTKKPTLNELERCIKKRGLKCLAGRVYSFWTHRRWFDKDGTEIFDADDAVERYNSKFPQKKSRLPKKSLKKIRRNAHRRACQRKSNEKRKVEHPKIDYDKQLKDQRWFDFREKVFEAKAEDAKSAGVRNICRYITQNINQENMLGSMMQIKWWFFVINAMLSCTAKWSEGIKDLVCINEKLALKSRNRRQMSHFIADK